MAVKIRLKRMGKIRAPFYRVVVMDSRVKRDGRAIEEIGKYHPTEEPSLIDINSERALHWLGLGAQPTEAVEALLKVTGDWQKFKGIDGTEGTLRVKAPRTSKKELYEAAMAATGSTLEAKDGATTPKKRAVRAEPRKAEPTKDEAPAAEPAPAAPAVPAPAAPATAEAKADDAKADEAAKADGGYGDDSAPATEDGAAPEGFDVKGNKDSMKFHEPDGQWYGSTVAEVWFRTAGAAEKAGFVKAGS